MAYNEAAASQDDWRPRRIANNNKELGADPSPRRPR
jgi:hypothetical protein